MLRYPWWNQASATASKGLRDLKRSSMLGWSQRVISYKLNNFVSISIICVVLKVPIYIHIYVCVSLKIRHILYIYINILSYIYIHKYGYLVNLQGTWFISSSCNTQRSLDSETGWNIFRSNMIQRKPLDQNDHPTLMLAHLPDCPLPIAWFKTSS